MNSNQVEFYSGTKGQLFRFIRTPSECLAHVLYVAPLFEEANKTRHMVTRSAIAATGLGIETIVFDHFGTGDSAGNLVEANLLIWQADILKQLHDIKAQSSKPVILSLCLSSALLLNDEIINTIDSLQLWQPEFNGRKFVQQFKRIALAANLNQKNSTKACEEENDHLINISGYSMSLSLLDDLSRQNLTDLSNTNITCTWFEWASDEADLPLARDKQLQSLQQLLANTIEVSVLSNKKFWQASELIVSEQLLSKEKQRWMEIKAMDNKVIGSIND